MPALIAHPQIIRTIALAAAALVASCLIGGCTTYRQFSFRVVDLETRQPVPGATVVVEQGIGDPPFGPKTHRADTDDQGIAKVIVANQPAVAVGVRAPGFVGERIRIRSPHHQPLAEPAHIGTAELLNDTEIELRILAGVESIVYLIVPDDFEGFIALEYAATSDWEPGQRRFRVEVVDGVAALPAAPALDVAHRFEARRASGDRIPGPLGSWETTQPMRSQIRLRGPVDGVRVPFYVIGDYDRFDRVMNAMYQ